MTVIFINMQMFNYVLHKRVLIGRYQMNAYILKYTCLEIKWQLNCSLDNCYY